MFKPALEKKSKRHEKDLIMSFSELTFLKPAGEKRWTREEQEKRNSVIKKKGEGSQVLAPLSIEPKITKKNESNLETNDKQSQQGQPSQLKNPVLQNIIFDDSLCFESVTFSISPVENKHKKAERPESTSSSDCSSDNDSQPSEPSSSDESTDGFPLRYMKRFE